MAQLFAVWFRSLHPSASSAALAPRLCCSRRRLLQLPTTALAAPLHSVQPWAIRDDETRLTRTSTRETSHRPHHDRAPRGDTLHPWGVIIRCAWPRANRAKACISGDRGIRELAAAAASAASSWSSRGWKNAGVLHSTWLQKQCACDDHVCAGHRRAVYVVATGSHEGLRWILADSRRRLREEVPEESRAVAS